MLMLLRRMGRADITAHGFRSTFRDWIAETTSTTREVAEMALAHVIPSKVEAAYRRGDLLEKRRALMDTWAGYCLKEAPTLMVVPTAANSPAYRSQAQVATGETAARRMRDRGPAGIVN